MSSVEQLGRNVHSHRCVLLAALVLGVYFGLGTPGAAPTPDPAAPSPSLLPTTRPGLSANEGVFLITTTDDGSEVIYFIAQDTRHHTLPGDLQLEQQLNPLWPVRIVDRDAVLAFPEAAPVGAAGVGRLSATVSDASQQRPTRQSPPTPPRQPTPSLSPSRRHSSTRSAQATT